MRLIPLFIFFYTLCLTVSQIIPCAKECAGCVTIGNTCSACPDNLELNTQGECIASQNNFCAIYSADSALCQSCQPTYRSQNGTCIKDMSGCLQYRGQKCLKCGFGKFLVDDSCKGTLNCQTYNNTLCTGCRQGYFFSRNICYSTDINCQRINYSNGACLKCASNCTLIGYECVLFNLTVKNCYVFNSTQCIICKNGYLLRNGLCYIVPICAINYYLSSSLTCVKFPFGCKSFDSSNFICKQCYPNFQNKNQTCQPVLPPYCTALDVVGNCSKCQQNYYPFNFTCRLVSPYCGKFNNQGKCLNCKLNTFSNADGLCKDPYCLNMTEYTCLQCKDNFKFSMQVQKCILVDINCINLKQQNCLQCYNGYYVSHDVCKQLPADCLNASKSGACLQCQRDYYLQFDTCFPINTNISNCRIYSKITNIPICLDCQLGFFVSLGKCLQIPSFCILVLSNGNCVNCISGYKLIANVCIPLKKGATDPNCVSMNNFICNRCNGNSVLGINGVCYPNINSTCLQSDQDGLCLQCTNGYLTNRGVCLNVVQIDVNCKTYSKNQCTQCYQGYYLNNNQCKLPNANCSSFNLTDGGCLSCFSGFILTNKQCVIVTKRENCLSYDSFGNCLQCSRMFYITNNTCFNVNPLCQNYNSFNGECTSCFPGYALKNKICVKQSSSVWSSITNITAVCKSMKGTQCVQCPYRYYLRQNQCILVSSTCATYNIDGNCLTCSTGYFLKNGNCINYGTLSGTDPNCKVFQRQSYCIQCYLGFVNVQGQCQSVDPLCRTYEATNGRCKSCYQGYSLTSGACKLQGMQQVNPCIQQNSFKQCIKCIQSYYVSGSKCKYNQSIKINNYNIPFCQIASNASYCTVCNDGFYPRDGYCYQVSVSCLTYSPVNGSCLTCKESNIFDSGTCVSPAMGFDPNCKTYQGVYCSVCISGFYIKNYVCALIDPKCVNFNYVVNQCLECRQGVPNFDVCQ